MQNDAIFFFMIQKSLVKNDNTTAIKNKIAGCL